MINSTGFGGNPFVICSGGGETQNTGIVTLLDTGNLVVREVNSNDSKFVVGNSGSTTFNPRCSHKHPDLK